MLVDKIPDVANLAVTALCFGQFVSDRPFSPAVALGGLALWLFLMGWVLSLTGE
jgi:hypothetical protein